MTSVPESAAKAAAVLIALHQVEQREPRDGLERRRVDAEIGRALCEAVQADRDEQSLIHVSWTTAAGRTSGRYLGDPQHYFQRRQLAEAAIALLEHLGFDLDDTGEAAPSPTTDPSETAA